MPAVRLLAHADAVVLDRQLALAGVKVEAEFDLFGPAMGDGVAHGFLGDPIQMHLPRRLQLHKTGL